MKIEENLDLSKTKCCITCSFCGYLEEDGEFICEHPDLRYPMDVYGGYVCDKWKKKIEEELLD